ncbi:ABC transporter ATP-binding protein [Cryobacterium sp. PH29-G1]|uniref:sulfate/molybdate ABC transporter ATP-binding protein n=1 Tax=Cryobacterium sp. PH29-G1 TaxID=3046211 RepID=UPI0024BBB52C|nr:ABC transporter ATP-binding protein [Cryobacterium sp. PH29-G1]MDJ0350049.1 ABC transporter ATP-binding protein [Cryobacterium sp. PH29-G1]
MLSIDASMPERGLEVSLRVTRGETVAILGPNGAGKSTLLGVLAGLVRPETGRAELAGRILFDLGSPGSRGPGHAAADAAPRTDRDQRMALVKRPIPERMPSRGERWLPAHARGVALLAQEPLLFPHLSAASNVAFGPRSSGAGRHEAHSRALHWLHEVDATELADRRPTELSGGQAQRVAVARALAAEPQLLLLDEPLSALDVAAAPLLRRMLRRVLVDQTVLLVTHDVLDALTLADRVVVMHDGHIIEEGPTRDVLERPRTRFTADLAALNLITGTSTPAGVVTDADASVVLPRTDAVPADIPVGTRVGVVVRPANVMVYRTAPRGSNLTVFRALVRDIEPRGDVVRVRSDVLFADLIPRAIADIDIEPGTLAFFAFDSSEAVSYAL